MNSVNIEKYMMNLVVACELLFRKHLGRCNEFGSTVLHDAVSEGNLDVFNALLSIAEELTIAPKFLFMQNDAGETSLYLAVSQMRADMIIALLAFAEKFGIAGDLISIEMKFKKNDDWLDKNDNWIN